MVCPAGTVALEGKCEGANDDKASIKEVRAKVVPNTKTLSSSVTFNTQSSWYCKFSCNKLFCAPDGCGWTKCIPGNVSVNKIELSIYNKWSFKVYSKTVNSQSSITWDGKNNKGKQLGNGTYGYQAKVYLTNGKSFTTNDVVKIKR